MPSISAISEVTNFGVSSGSGGSGTWMLPGMGDALISGPLRVQAFVSSEFAFSTDLSLIRKHFYLVVGFREGFEVKTAFILHE